MGIKPLPGRRWELIHKLYLTALWPTLAIAALFVTTYIYRTIEHASCERSLAAQQSSAHAKTADGWEEVPLDGRLVAGSSAIGPMCPPTGNGVVLLVFVLPALFVFGLYRWIRWMFGPQSLPAGEGA